MEHPEKIDLLQAIQMAVPASATEVKPKTIHHCFRHCQIRSEPGATMPVPVDELMDSGVLAGLASQIREFRYSSPMDVRNLLDYPAEQEVAFVPDIEDVVENQLTTVEADDNSREHP
ncbi:hypothetical protein SeMB42_g07979 [Synchytrium endobioticum]|uniref:Uncharacterized protein n=1 Tax=Synchytrium endobioticum TaxID=286115 RepID=A0A507BGC9_9FUNG|nr:hypothetical protein SeMB42_g07979 [Synchytrium endobioticum]TPX51054.1 hypothetical protein SeLEV6574_g00554 [Synchytrium endobioticum]